MQRNLLLTLPLAFVLSCFAFLMVSSSSAKAALAGDDGRILYIDPACQSVCQSDVVTTDAQGTTPVVAASSEAPVTAATISNPNASNGYDIVYAELTQNNTTDAVLQKVTIDANGSPVEGPAVLAVLTPLYSDPSVDTQDRVVNLSYSPDSSSVLATQKTNVSPIDVDPEDEIDPPAPYDLFGLVVVDTTTGDKNPIVSARQDACLNGGYGNNGGIFFSMADTEFNGNCEQFYLEGLNSDIFYIAPGATFADRVQLTSTTGVAEYFIDVSPDGNNVLVADANSPFCGYQLFVRTSDPAFAGLCDYYYVSVNNPAQEPVLLADLNLGFIPMYFSPDNQKLIGIQMDVTFDGEFLSIGEPLGTAIVQRADIAGTPQIISPIVGVRQWAPIAAAVPVVPEVPAVTHTTTAITLPATGSNAAAAAVLLSLFALIATASIIAGVVTIKK